nr:hypothetical protein [Tanacetum cinerariifolium]
MFKLDLEPLAPKLVHNREFHINYIKHTQEQADILQGIVEQAKAKQPLDNVLDFSFETRIIPGPVGILQKALARKKADVQAGGHHNILKTQEYVRKVNKDVSEDDHFMQGPWLQAIVYLHGEGLTVSGCLDDMKKICQEGKLELVVGVVKSCTPNSLGDMIVTLKDPTGTMGGTIHYKVFQDEKIGGGHGFYPVASPF